MYALIDPISVLVFGVDTTTLIDLVNHGAIGETARIFLAGFGINI